MSSDPFRAFWAKLIPSAARPTKVVKATDKPNKRAAVKAARKQRRKSK